VFDDGDEELACGLMIIAAINSHCFFIIGVHLSGTWVT
jgi:hypothetical protein